MASYRYLLPPFPPDLQNQVILPIQLLMVSPREGPHVMELARIAISGSRRNFSRMTNLARETG